MKNTKQYEEYQQLKEVLAFTRKGINYGKVLSFDIAMVIFSGIVNRHSFKSIAESFYILPSVRGLLQDFDSHEKLCTYTYGRKDYESQIHESLKDLSSVTFVCLEWLPYRFYINCRIVLESMVLVFGKMLHVKYNIKTKLYLASKLAMYMSIQRQLEKHKFKVSHENKKYITFNSAIATENLLTQFFKEKCIPTYSLCHSYFVPYKHFIPIDVINGENIVSDYTLAWGKTFIEDLNRNYAISPDKVLIAGNPKYPKKSIVIKQTFKVCIVLLGRIFYHESNIKIIKELSKISKKENILFCLKLHPSLDVSLYRQLCDDTTLKIIETKESLTELLESDNYDFAIVNNSTAYYEAMYYNLICLRYEPSENESFIGLDDYFHDAESLQAKIVFFKTTNITVLNTEIEYLLQNTIGMGINQYKELLES
ncbi:MAG: hypothetical protein QE277_05905 [Flectobacillus sp.]|nr:hypothetical protein [Flectobacillus sp.]